MDRKTRVKLPLILVSSREAIGSGFILLSRRDNTFVLKFDMRCLLLVAYVEHITHYISYEIVSLVVAMLYTPSLVRDLPLASPRPPCLYPQKINRVIFIVGMHRKPGYDCTWPVAVLRFGPKESLVSLIQYKTICADPVSCRCLGS